MDCKVFVIVDFDNFFPRPIPEIPINKIEFLFKEIVRDIITRHLYTLMYQTENRMSYLQR
jgi:hypothetical protein